MSETTETGPRRPFFYDTDIDDMTALCAELGWPVWRAGQLLAWQKRGIESFDQMTDQSLAARAELAARFSACGLETVRELKSEEDDTVKFLYGLWDRQRIESVLMRYRFGLSCCVSSEAGCAMGCAFCASAAAPYGRRLTAGEMFAQVAQMGRYGGERIANVTVMGTGEPLNNLDQLRIFLHRLHDEKNGMGLSYRHMTVSTCGLIGKMLEFAEEVLPVTLSISLHAPNQALRETLMPVARLYPFNELIDAARYWVERTGRRVTFEYALFRDVNDRPGHAAELARRLRGLLCHVNLIPANPVPGLPYEASTAESVRTFRSVLEDGGINATVRRSLGRDVNASCGQLRRRTP